MGARGIVDIPGLFFTWSPKNSIKIKLKRMYSFILFIDIITYNILKYYISNEHKYELKLIKQDTISNILNIKLPLIV